jgi:hypothetical protein
VIILFFVGFLLLIGTLSVLKSNLVVRRRSGLGYCFLRHCFWTDLHLKEAGKIVVHHVALGPTPLGVILLLESPEHIEFRTRGLFPFQAVIQVSSPPGCAAAQKTDLEWRGSAEGALFDSEGKLVTRLRRKLNIRSSGGIGCVKRGPSVNDCPPCESTSRFCESDCTLRLNL